ncbi:hypothetical protein [Sphingomonas sp. M1-B02]|uniref:hypothetical protein n=1 Tax=Sphingomonas sp. M1-B02 TaxID=3114300 RepID=UPI002240BDAA|nr:hypothetical protein [Sphingomonas sp. S6-11]UZK65927.1 hypothetical protein OKW87_15685 [Sphingomonas sp. S6-11]
MRLPAALLLAVALTAGCKPAPSGPTLQAKEAARAGEVAKLTGWDRAFTPDAALGAANQFGFRPTPYAAAEGAYRSSGGPVMISSSGSAKPNRIAFAASGKAADKIDTIAFDLSITDAPGAGDAQARMADLVRDFLFQSKIDAKPIHDAIAEGKSAKGALSGTPYAIEKTADQLLVTFTRTGASAPANS